MSDKPASPARGRKKTAPPAQQPPQEEVVVCLPLADLYPFPDHPFQVRDDEEMRETIQSVKEYGVIVPAIVRPREEGGYQKKFKNGEIVLNTGLMLGYVKAGKDAEGRDIYEINEEEATIVRRIYGEYLAGVSIHRICRGLEADGIPTKLGKKRWAYSVVHSILRNEKYTGNAILGKTYKPDVLTKYRKKNNGQAPMYYVEGTHPAIIDKEMFDVDGKLEGQRGRVVEVAYNFKIKVSDYKRVIGLADTDVHGQFFNAESHFVTFDRAALPQSKIVTWYKAPANEDDEYVSGSDDSSFHLDDLKSMKISAAIAERCHDYYMENKVRYISIDGTKGYAIVEGSEPYEVEFEYLNGEISGLVCSCFCSYNCKHEFAAMLQLKETLEMIEKYYATQYDETGYFAAVNKGALFAIAIDGKETGRFTL